MQIRSFGKLSDGRSAGLYILSNRNGMQVHLTEYGASIVRLIVPGRDEKFRDVVLGYDDVSGYEKGGVFFGATVGRFANRISNASFDMNGRHYILTANDGPNTLHGGRDFYNQRLWSPVISFGEVSTAEIAASYAVESMNDWSRELRGAGRREINRIDAAAEIGIPSTDTDETASVGDRITFRLVSPDGDQGFPGELHISVTYTLTDDNELHIDYSASLDTEEERSAIRPSAKAGSADDDTHVEIGIPATGGAAANAGKNDYVAEDEGAEQAAGKNRKLATPLNLTNHSYFNLNGHDSGTVLMQKVWINADQFTEADSRSIPTGTLLDVKWTPMDFRQAKELGQDIDNDYEPLRFGNGYDHNYVLRSSEEAGAEESTSRIEGQTAYREVASMVSDDSGIQMTVLTDLPGMQLYTANYVDGEPGKDGAVYGKRSAACFETQFWPDAVNKEGFPGGVLREGEEFTSRTTYKFSIIE